jgi:hypothetical protein
LIDLELWKLYLESFKDAWIRLLTKAKLVCADIIRVQIEPVDEDTYEEHSQCGSCVASYLFSHLTSSEQDNKRALLVSYLLLFLYLVINLVPGRNKS